MVLTFLDIFSLSIFPSGLIALYLGACILKCQSSFIYYIYNLCTPYFHQLFYTLSVSVYKLVIVKLVTYFEKLTFQGKLEFLLKVLQDIADHTYMQGKKVISQYCKSLLLQYFYIG
jgi:hypothetical protein